MPAPDLPGVRFPASMWCPIGNIVETRPYGPGGRETRSGTLHFAPGTKVYYLGGMPFGMHDRIRVLGKHRGEKGGLEAMVILSEWVSRWRAKVIYSPAVIRQLCGDDTLYPYYGPVPPLWTQDEAERIVEIMQARERTRQAPTPPAGTA